jgi:secreted trypsin-like serine protease
MARKRKEVFAIIGGGDLFASSERKLCSVQETFAADFDQYSFQNDIALVKIQCEWKIDQQQQVIELSQIEPLQSCDYDCLIFGYGAESFETNMKPSSALRFGSVRVITQSTCETLMGRVAAPMPHTGHFCARGLAPAFADACSGDSGSALICRSNASSRYQLVGIVSYGSGCGSKFSAGVYESVFFHRQWIDLTLQNE